MPSPTGLTGAAGEYYVAAELSRRDWLATVTIKNAPGTDVLAQRRDRRRVVAIQTKTATLPSNFTLNVKDESPGERDDEWYALVALGALDQRPEFYVLPRHVMAAITWMEHRDWLWNVNQLRAPMRPGGKRTANTRRTIRRPWVANYLDRWDLLDESAWEVPYLGDPRFLELERHLPLPDEFRRLEPASHSPSVPA